MAFTFHFASMNAVIIVIFISLTALLFYTSDGLSEQPKLSFLGALNGSPNYVDPNDNNNSINKIDFRNINSKPLDEIHWPQQQTKPTTYFEALLKPPSNNPSHVRRKIYGNSQSNHRDQYDQCNVNYKFDYLKLSLQWGPGFCETSPRKCQKVVNRFTIHGMWPNRLSGLGPENCCFDNIFDYSKIESLENDLNQYWPSFFGGDSRAFWSHEWTKHGTCTRDIPDLKGEKRYFGNTLNLVKKMPIMDTLSKANIVPTKNRSYPTSLINRALASMTGGKNVEIDCDKEHTQPIPILKGIDFCLDGQLKFVDCPSQKQRCSNQVYFFN